jgi:hypothetical protein
MHRGCISIIALSKKDLAISSDGIRAVLTDRYGPVEHIATAEHREAIRS